ncbi:MULTISPECIES: AzlC family ABC transporter permease [unclassified Rhizobium]|uniref:AzlC family ABC transporter permease n=1 Tax=unclassified Rhizobium TaxID=2613769 RepID=UPI000DDEE297|nr:MULTISPECIES: AzlC family ABC transporter permease [unclassified Rhizobium]MBB3288251.1 4-azaleucine resistance transporter AzlC [Rhizobium sp. BK252]MBB3402885.1 4-azaleucine resistance transporter AzlC [Rhizobium sp. BK289]MBB3415462.1 4-azaleucine resistance transporter AzlC [Rhizobium sp. BK284]MBB3483457.1 4-azaleucine resistance transporter AzlC [Rhizobium sp. BK347]MDK4723481.1 AzlC family ABC transporter permease [Rhizobium sp. CNPSo 3968]
MLQQSRPAGEFKAGMRAIFPLIVAVLPIGLVFGAISATKGLSPLEAMLMSALVFAGGSQFVAMDIWTHPASWIGVGFAALLVNVRHLLMSASIGTKMQSFSGIKRYLAMLFLADEIWAMAEFRAGTMRLTPAWYAGIVTPFYLAWIGSSLAGALLGAFLGDPAVIGLDFAFPAVFIVLVMGFWKGPETGAVLAASGIAAVAVHQFVPGVWHIAAGALAGLAVAFWKSKTREQTA